MLYIKSNKVAQTSSLLNNIEKIKNKIESVANKTGMNAEKITVVAVTKNRRIEEITEVVNYGIKNIGENRVQEAEKKFARVSDIDRVSENTSIVIASKAKQSQTLDKLGTFKENEEICNISRASDFGLQPSDVSRQPSALTLHMIGHLQSNKSEKAVEIFDIVQSVDSFKLAKTLSEHSKKINKKITIFLQVNTSLEETKYGFTREELLNNIEKIASLDNLDIAGIMTIGPLTDEKEKIRISFRETKKIFDDLSTAFPSIKDLSMGMSDDYDIAIEEGSTMLRIGRAIFERKS